MRWRASGRAVWTPGERELDRWTASADVCSGSHSHRCVLIALMGQRSAQGCCQLASSRGRKLIVRLHLGVRVRGSGGGASVERERVGADGKRGLRVRLWMGVRQLRARRPAHEGTWLHRSGVGFGEVKRRACPHVEEELEGGHG